MEGQNSYVYLGYYCYSGDVYIEIPRWEHRATQEGITSLWLKFYNPYELEHDLMVKTIKQKFAKRDNPFDIIDYKGVIHVLRQLKSGAFD